MTSIHSEEMARRDGVGRSATPEARLYRQARIEHWDRTWESFRRSSWGRAYQRRLREVYRFFVPPGSRVLELGCGNGDLLASLAPSRGVGVDFSAAALRRCAELHPELERVQADAHDLPVEGPFDFVILSDLVNDLYDVQGVLEQVAGVASPETRVMLNAFSWAWQVPLGMAEAVGWKTPQLEQNWLTPEDVHNLLALTGFEMLRESREVLLPAPIPFLASFCNTFLVKLWPIQTLALTRVVVARPEPRPRDGQPTVSVVVAARNEEGNVEAIFDRVPDMGAGTELVFVEGHSRDDTYAAIERAIAARPGRRARLFRQKGEGKGDAVRLGFAEATGDVLMILDADLTVPPEDLPRFLDAVWSRRGEYVNGVRLVYPMEDEAMRPFNLIGNKFFTLALSWLLGQPIKDTLCGTKVLLRKDYERLAAGRSYFGDFDPFGDFDLIFGAAKLNLKMVDLPVRYRARTYGTTNIARWRHGFLLLRMVLYASTKLKFV